MNTESIRQLGDGTTITLKNRRAIARDNAGRIFQERRLLVPDDGKPESIVTQIEISDPIAHELCICVPREGVCQGELFSAPALVPPPTTASAPKQPGSPNLEYLGEQSIGGLETVGIRETAVIETGAIGNNNPIETKREYWYAQQIGVNLISKLQDPRFGTQNFEVTDIAWRAGGQTLQIARSRQADRPAEACENPRTACHCFAQLILRMKAMLHEQISSWRISDFTSVASWERVLSVNACLRQQRAPKRFGRKLGSTRARLAI